MKKILIDLYKIKDVYSGLGQFSMNFAKELMAKLPDELSIDFLVPKNRNVPFSGKNIETIKSSLLKRYMPRMNKDYSIWHSLHQFPSFFPNKNTVWILTIHDLNFLIEKNGIKRNRYRRQLQKNIDRADYITTISNFTKSEIEKNLNTRQKEIQVIYNGVPSGSDIEKIKPSFADEKKFFFSIGIFSKKKNFEVLLPLMKHFETHQLIIAGNNETAYGKEIENEIKRLSLEDRIILPGKISDSNKQWLYANCEALLFPSLAEGFGLPAIEAMYEGKPIFLSQATSLPEIGGTMAFYFENFDPQSMADSIRSKMEKVYQNQEKFAGESKAFARQYNWENCIDEYLKLYKKAKLDSRNI